jgi:hypothetical protein
MHSGMYLCVCVYLCMCVCIYIYNIIYNSPSPKLSLLLGPWSLQLSQDALAYAGLLHNKADMYVFRFPLQCKWDMCSLGMECSIEWYNSRLHKISKGCTSQSWHGQGLDKRDICRLAYPGILFRGCSTNSVEDRGQKEQGSGGSSPLIRSSAQFADEWIPYSY